MKEPQNAEKTNESLVFYCTYNSDRQVQKNGEYQPSLSMCYPPLHKCIGWKRVDVSDAWFKNFDKSCVLLLLLSGGVNPERALRPNPVAAAYS